MQQQSESKQDYMWKLTVLGCQGRYGLSSNSKSNDDNSNSDTSILHGI